MDLKLKYTGIHDDEAIFEASYPVGLHAHTFVCKMPADDLRRLVSDGLDEIDKSHLVKEKIYEKKD